MELVHPTLQHQEPHLWQTYVLPLANYRLLPAMDIPGSSRLLASCRLNYKFEGNLWQAPCHSTP
eukprot:4826230-Amphidinium_carterae.1